MSQYENAKILCKLWHGEQKRKYTGEPYYLHPFAVADRLNHTFPFTEPFDHVLCAAVLHDVLEDTKATEQDIKTVFGEEVCKLVKEVTDVSRPSDGNREIRKIIDRIHLSRASEWGQAIKCADMIDNTESIVAHDKDFAALYLKEKEKTLKVLTKAPKSILLDAWESLEKAYNTLKQS